MFFWGSISTIVLMANDQHSFVPHTNEFLFDDILNHSSKHNEFDNFMTFGLFWNMLISTMILGWSIGTWDKVSSHGSNQIWTICKDETPNHN
jgi:hypothetical protein